tara:strand:- start:11739 stop:12146 length:408 start_codon:yes stop_codon:yes gene_type:complete
MKQDQALWCEVLSLAINDALTGTSFASKNRATRIHEIERNRKYLTVQNVDFDMVCSLAGVDPVATREQLIRRIADAPAPEELISVKRRPQRRTTRSRERASTMRGVGKNIAQDQGTGGGTVAQETPNITFQDRTV